MPLVTSPVVPRRPNFVILGAPKCGTTALSEYLRDHPQVFVSRPKEPHYFCDDWDYYYAPGERTEEHYLHLFDDATGDHLAVGEASVWYLYSAAAASNIAAFDPAERAWDLQESRAAGDDLPETVRVPEFLQYGAAASLGAQLQRVHEFFPREQVKVLVMDDLKADTGAVYREALAFLGVPDDGRTEFPRVNENKVHQRPAVARFTQRPPAPLVAVAKGVKRVAGIERLGVLDRVRRTNRQVTRREEISPEFADRLRVRFRDDVALLGDLIGRDLGAWTR